MAHVPPFVLILLGVVQLLFLVGLIVVFVIMLKKGKHVEKLAEHTEEMVAKAAGQFNESAERHS